METIAITASGLYVSKRLDAFLTDSLAGRFSRQQVKTAIEEGRVTLNGKPARPSSPVKDGDAVEARLVENKESVLEPEDIPIKVVYEDASLLVVDKPLGMIVHPGAGNKKGTLVHALLGRGGKLSSVSGADRPGIVHRLDKDTTGLLVVAKNDRAHRKLQSQFESRTVSKTYLAIVKGDLRFEEGHVDKSIGRDPKVRGKRAVSDDGTAKEAYTEYKVRERFRRATLLEVKIRTGRTHQIRVHMAHEGHPVVGDTIYGSPAPRLALHAWRLAFDHPDTGKRVEFESPIPADFQALIDAERNKK